MSGAVPDDATESTVDIPKGRRDRPALERGACVERYIIVDQLGSGGMGVVYKAFDPELGRPVAIKLLHTGAGQGDMLRDRLLREAQALARLSHPNVIAVHDVGTFGANVFVAMEFVEGQTLRRWLAEVPRSRREVLDVFLAAGAGVAAAHRAKLVHRDFKPDNVIVGNDGRVRVLDFGLARDAQADDHSGTPPSKVADSPPNQAEVAPAQTDAEAPAPDPVTPSGDRLLSALTVAGSIMGTPRFMAPEQHLGQIANERADQFSFCVSLYVALYDQFPFAGDTAEAYEHSVLEGRIQEPPAGSHVPRGLRQVLLRGLMVRPEARWPSMQALLEQLARDPTAVRRRALVLSGLALALVVAGVAGYRALGAPDQLCRGAEARLSGVWDPSVKASVERAFVASGKPYAATVWRSVAAALDGFAGEWTAMHGETCRATRVRGEQSEDVLALRMACLDERLSELRALTTILRDADGNMVNRALEAAKGLGSVRGCADIAALSAPVRPPADPATRAAVASLRERLAEAKAQRIAKNPKAALTLAGPLVAEARALKYRPVEAEALELRGELESASGDHKAAAETLLEALSVATRSHHDEVAARAAIERLDVVGYWQAHHELADELAVLADVTLARIGSPDELEATRLLFLATILGEEGSVRGALETAQRALAIAKRRYGAQDWRLVAYENSVGMALWQNGDLGPARAAYEHALALVERDLGRDHPHAGVLMGNLGILARDDGRLDESVALERRSLAIKEAAYGPDHPSVAIALCNLGGSLRRQGHFREGLAINQRALAIYDAKFSPDYTNSWDPLTEIGLDLIGLGRADEARSPLERALRIEERDKLAPDSVASTRFALAQALWAMNGDRPRARLLATQARDGFARVPTAGKRRAEVDAWLGAHGDASR